MTDTTYPRERTAVLPGFRSVCAVARRSGLRGGYVLATGCQWRALPSDFPPRSTVQGYFYAWRDTGLWRRIVSKLVRRARRALRRKPTPTVAIIDSQSTPTTESGGPRGYDAGKRVHGRKRHIVTDKNGLVLDVRVHPANIQDVHGAVPLLEHLRVKFPKLRRVLADRVYRGDQLVKAPHTAAPGTLRSSSARPASKASSCCRGDGSWSEPSHGSDAAAASPRTSRHPSQAQPLGSSSHI